jgi:hypothetical protein
VGDGGCFERFAKKHFRDDECFSVYLGGYPISPSDRNVWDELHEITESFDMIKCYNII